MSNWNCTYSKTVSGNCDQAKTCSSDYCYYHDKVVEGHIEADEENALRDMPAIVL